MATIPSRETAYAKVNLALHVRRRRDDGYHDIDTLFAFVDRGDEVRAEVRRDGRLSLAIEGPFADSLSCGPDNLVLRSAEALREGRSGWGADLILTKNLPVASGIGGGSADAAATLRLLARLWGVHADSETLRSIGTSLGADVPACVDSVTSIGVGTGTELTPADGPVSGLHILLANPRLPVSTAAIFKAWDGLDGGALPAGDALLVAREGRNDLQAPALTLCPAIGPLLEALAATRPIVSRMSGSGATCFGLYDGAETLAAAEAALKDRFPNLWTLGGRLR